MSEPVVLGIESTCDETAAAIVRGRELLSNVVASSMEEHARYGGVIPEIASRAHAEAFVPCVSKALADANMTLADVDAIAVSAGPGLAGCLAVGVSGAKALAWAANKPIYGINHVIGHIAVTQLQFGPFPKDTLALIVSGGHTSLLKQGKAGHETHHRAGQSAEHIDVAMESAGYRRSNRYGGVGCGIHVAADTEGFECAHHKVRVARTQQANQSNGLAAEGGENQVAVG